MRFNASCILKKYFCVKEWCDLFSNYLTALEYDCHERALTASAMFTLKNVFLLI